MAEDFDPRQYMIKIKGKEYLPVAARIHWFRLLHPTYTISTKFVELTPDWAVCQAVVADEDGGVLSVGHKQEYKVAWQDHLEKAETGAVGRALALLGYGTLNAQELELEVSTGGDLGTKVVDSPQDPRPDASTSTRPVRGGKKDTTATSTATADTTSPAMRSVGQIMAVDATSEKARLVAYGRERGIAWEMTMDSSQMGDVVERMPNMPKLFRQPDGKVKSKDLWNIAHALKTISEEIDTQKETPVEQVGNVGQVGQVGQDSH